MEEQLKQEVIGKRYCISRKRKSYKWRTSRASPSVKCLVLSLYYIQFNIREEREFVFPERAKLREYVRLDEYGMEELGYGRICLHNINVKYQYLKPSKCMRTKDKY